MAVTDDLDRATDSKWDWVAEHTRKYLASGGTEGHESNGVYTLVLATTGRRTGEPRRTCLIYGTSGDEFVVVASKGGADEDPAWFKNLQADSSVGVQVGTRRFTARARVASPVEREPLWAQMAFSSAATDVPKTTSPEMGNSQQQLHHIACKVTTTRIMGRVGRTRSLALSPIPALQTARSNCAY